MFLEKTSKNIKGYLEVKVFGFFIERFLNLAMNSDANIWGVKKIDDATATLCIDMSSYKKLVLIASKTGCKLNITKKFGVPFFFLKHKRRPTFPILFLFKFLSQIVFFYFKHYYILIFLNILIVCFLFL